MCMLYHELDELKIWRAQYVYGPFQTNNSVKKAFYQMIWKTEMRANQTILTARCVHKKDKSF